MDIAYEVCFAGAGISGLLAGAELNGSSRFSLMVNVYFYSFRDLRWVRILARLPLEQDARKSIATFSLLTIASLRILLVSINCRPMAAEVIIGRFGGH